MLFRFEKAHSLLYCFFKLHGKTLIHLFSSSNQDSLCIEIKLFFFRIYTINTFVPIATFGLVKGNNKPFLNLKYDFMVFKCYAYKSNTYSILLHQLDKVKNLEKSVTFNN